MLHVWDIIPSYQKRRDTPYFLHFGKFQKNYIVNYSTNATYRGYHSFISERGGALIFLYLNNILQYKNFKLGKKYIFEYLVMEYPSILLKTKGTPLFFCILEILYSKLQYKCFNLGKKTFFSLRNDVFPSYLK